MDNILILITAVVFTTGGFYSVTHWRLNQIEKKTTRLEKMIMKVMIKLGIQPNGD